MGSAQWPTNKQRPYPNNNWSFLNLKDLQFFEIFLIVGRLDP